MKISTGKAHIITSDTGVIYLLLEPVYGNYALAFDGMRWTKLSDEEQYQLIKKMLGHDPECLSGQVTLNEDGKPELANPYPFPKDN